MAKKNIVSCEMKALRVERDNFMCALYDVVNKRVAWSAKWKGGFNKVDAYRVGVTVHRDAWPLVLMQFFPRGQCTTTRVVPIDQFKDEMRRTIRYGGDTEYASWALSAVEEIERKGKV